MLVQTESERRLPCASGRAAPWNSSVLEPLSTFSTMIGLISHDLRHPLSLILANAEFLTCANTEVERSDSYREIRWAIDRMNDLISSLMEFSKGRETLRPAWCNILDSLERAIRMVRARPEFQNIAIDHRHTGRVAGWFDPHRIERVIANLVLNACEAVPPASGHVVVTTTGSRADLRMAVWDNGPGVPAEIRDSVFQPFVSSGKIAGSGLGLAIAKKIVEDHGGRIRLSRADGKGTLFEFTIPFSMP